MIPMKHCGRSWKTEPAANLASSWQETRLKEGDSLHGVTGTNILLLAGSGRVTYVEGAVIDATAGTVVPSGSALVVNHRYITAEDAAPVFTITSKTAVVDYQGQYSFTYSASPDYNAMASALKTLHLFKGTFTGYGEGFDLEAVPTRLQALIMFIRVLGRSSRRWHGLGQRRSGISNPVRRRSSMWDTPMKRGTPTAIRPPASNPQALSMPTSIRNLSSGLWDTVPLTTQICLARWITL